MPTLYIYIYNSYTSVVYTILLKRKLKTKTIGHYPPRAIHHANKIKIFGVDNEILIKYKRIKWAPSHKALHSLPQG